MIDIRINIVIDDEGTNRILKMIITFQGKSFKKI